MSFTTSEQANMKGGTNISSDCLNQYLTEMKSHHESAICIISYENTDDSFCALGSVSPMDILIPQIQKLNVLILVLLRPCMSMCNL